MDKKTEPDFDSVLDAYESAIVAYVQDFMKRVDMPIDKEGAENIISNVGMRIYKRKATS